MKDTEEGRPLRVAFICEDLMIGGWTSIVQAILAFPRDRIEPVVVCLFGKGPNAELLEKSGITVRCFYFKRFNFIWKIILLALFLRRERVDIVHTHLLLSHILGQFAAFLARVPGRVMHMHTIIERRGGALGAFMNLAVSLANMVVSVSCTAQNAFRDVFPGFHGESRVVYNGINVESIRREVKACHASRDNFGIPEDVFLVLTVANLKWQKGHKHLIEAAEILKDDSMHFLLVGQGPEKESLQDAALRKGVGGNFHFAGSILNPVEAFAVADIFVLPSVLEGFGISLIEAFSVGLPSVASEVGGIPEIVVDRENALLVPPGNPEALARAIKELKNDSILRGRLAANALERANKFDIGEMIEQYESAYFAVSSRKKNH